MQTTMTITASETSSEHMQALGVVSKHIHSHRPNTDKCERGPWVSAAGKRARSSRGAGAVAAGQVIGAVTRLKVRRNSHR
jgi:hypothetical protein